MVFDKIFGKKETEEEIKERERRRLQNERCAKLREEIARDLEEERKRKQQELIRQGDENAIRRQEWVKKMAEARLQKKLQKEKEEAEYLENKRKYCIQLENELNSIGVSFIVTKEFCYDIFVPENIEFKKIFDFEF